MTGFKRVGFTKLGFSKPFACCSFWEICDMGKKPELCVYREKDEETMLNCGVYQKNQKIREENEALQMAFDLFDLRRFKRWDTPAR
jgi:hypothetical protein